MKIVGVGDIFIAKRLPRSYYEGYDELCRLINCHDACFGNLETTVHDNEGYPSRFPGGGYAMSSPIVLKDVKKFGFNILNIANNHALDYSHRGLEATIKHLKAEGLVYVGGGINLVEASRPKYIECPDGRVAFIGVTSSFHDSDAAGAQGGFIQGRPGVNPLRRLEYYEITEDLYSMLSQMADETGMNDGHQWAIKNGYRTESKELFLRDLKFIRGESNRRITHPLQTDMDRIVNSIKEASLQADCVVVSFHSHQMNRSANVPADFIVEFCHTCIDAGANVIFGHGAHELRGVEVYKNAPVFYGLCDFIFQNEMVDALPYEFYEKNKQESDKFDFVGLGMNLRSKGETRGLSADPKAWEAILASIRFEKGMIKKVEAYPISLGYEKGRTQRGWPVIDKTGVILDNFCNLSTEKYGTEFKIASDHAEVII